MFQSKEDLKALGNFRPFNLIRHVFQSLWLYGENGKKIVIVVPRGFSKLQVILGNSIWKKLSGKPSKNVDFLIIEQSRSAGAKDDVPNI